MKRNSMRALPVPAAVLLLVAMIATPAAGQTSPPPIELRSIQITYQIQNEFGQLVWKETPPNAPATIPASALRLRFIATINRRRGDRVNAQAIIQETCFPLGGGKTFLSKLRPLAESPMSEQPVSEDGKVTFEVQVHPCEPCEGPNCPQHMPCDREHLGEGPHSASLVTSDASGLAAEGTVAGRDAQAAASHPTAFVLNFNTVCPRDRRRPRPRSRRRP